MDSGETIGTRDLLTVCPWLTGPMTVPPYLCNLNLLWQLLSVHIYLTTRRATHSFRHLTFKKNNSQNQHNKVLHISQSVLAGWTK